MRDVADRLFGYVAGVGQAAGRSNAANQTVTGELISVWCYIQSSRNVGEAGYLCALADLKWEGNPAGILTRDGKVYQLAGPAVGENNSQVVAHIGRTVSATGDVVEKDGIRILTARDLKVVSG